ncbi:MAG: hypothetical protein HXX09_13800 [Bacteroidetes bacterium]|nr:hypothetical protein [Bacteroidota bacterium]
MLFEEKILEIEKLLNPAFDNLFQLVINNQIHAGDLLLVYENGSYNSNLENDVISNENSLPYSIGPTKDVFSECTHFKFIEAYRDNYMCKITQVEYLSKIQETNIEKDELNSLVFREELSIQLEMLIYLKIWEADSFIRKFYQLARLANGIEYDSHFRIAVSDRDKEFTGTRQEIIRNKIRKMFKDKLPILYNSFKNSYKTQIRNSIAHSNYSFVNRIICLNNYIKGVKGSELKILKFENWVDIFHETMVLYNEYVKFFNKVNSYYSEIAKDKNNLIDIRLCFQNIENKIEIRQMEYRPDWDDFKLKFD